MSRPQPNLRSRTCMLLGIFTLLTSVQAAYADGGRLRFRQPAGPFIVTLFTTPDPLTKGRADFSIAVERPGMPGLVQDADVSLILTPPGHGEQLVLHASHAQATSKWLQAANFQVRSLGLWHVTVTVRRGTEAGKCSGEFQVLSAATRDLTWDVLPVPLAGLFFLLHQALKGKYNRDRRKRMGLTAS